MSRDLEERLTHLDRLLDEGLELGATEQQAWLARLRSVEPALAGELVDLLAREAEIDAAGFLQHPAPVEPRVTSLAGRRIGAYTLERPLGRGVLSAWGCAEAVVRLAQASER